MDALSTSAEIPSRLKWRCRRGMKELDVVLLRFLQEDYLKLTPEQQQAFSDILDWEDPDLYASLLGQGSVNYSANLYEIIERLRLGH